MKFFRRLFSRHSRNDAAFALDEVDDRLKGCVSPMIVALAKARAIRRMRQGCSPSAAAKLAITWALCVDHPESA